MAQQKATFASVRFWGGFFFSFFFGGGGRGVEGGVGGNSHLELFKMVQRGDDAGELPYSTFITLD